MAKGRKPKPAAVRDLEGDLGKRPRPAPRGGNNGPMPEMPSYFGDEEKHAWETLAKEMRAVGLLDILDAHAFESYCRVYGEARRLWATIADERNHDIGVHPGVKEARQLEAVLNKLRSEMGLNATSRTALAAQRLDPKTDAEDDNPLSFNPAA